jgi:predicted ester cyclase
MSAEQNQAVVRRFVEEVLNKGNLAVLDEVMAPNYVNHTPFPGLPPNIEGWKAIVPMVRNAFPDVHVTIEDMIVEGDKLMFRDRAHGTHKGELFGVPPTGEEMTWMELHVIRFAGGKITDHWALGELPGVMHQLAMSAH